jgi:hypothetical protein
MDGGHDGRLVDVLENALGIGKTAAGACLDGVPLRLETARQYRGAERTLTPFPRPHQIRITP